MSVTLLAPWALAAAALLAIPVILHLFKPRRVRQTPFSSLRWLHLTPQKLSRRIQWHQVLLFLLRAAFLTLLVLALARPLLSSAESAGVRERFIVLDVSHSMNYQTSGQAAPIERARTLAIELMRRNQPGDRTAVLLTGMRTRLLTPLTREPATFEPRIRELTAGLTETDLCSALPVIQGLWGRGKENSAAEIWFVTDNPQNGWRQGAPALFQTQFDQPAKVHVVDVGVAGPQNAWISRARLLEVGRPARKVLRVELGCVGDATQERTVHLEATAGLPERSQPIMLAPGRSASVDFDVPADLELNSGMLRFTLDPPDGLTADDEFLLNLDGQGAVRVLLVEGPPAGTDPLPGGFHLRNALEALADASGQPLQLTARAAAEVQADDVRAAEVILLVDVPELSADVLPTLEERVREGMGLGIFLGDTSKPAFLNEKLHRPLQPSESLLPSAVQPEGVSGRLVGLTDVQWSHPIFAGLGDPLVGDLGLTRFHRWHRFVSTNPEGATVLARIDGEAPAVVERNVGAGRVLIFNTGAGDRWSDLARRKSFVPLVDRVLTHLSPAGIRRGHVVGDVVTLPLMNWQPGDDAVIVTPSGRRVVPAVRPLPGKRGQISFEATEAGVHRLERPEGGFPFVVQVGRGDSALAPMDATTLKQWWEPTSCKILRGDDLARQLDGESGRHAVWPWLLLAAGLVFLAEMYLVHRVCPRANPPLTQNIVGRRGLFRSARRSSAE